MDEMVQEVVAGTGQPAQNQYGLARSKTVFCFRFIHEKFKCITLAILLIIMCLEIVKLSLPALSADEKKEITKGLLRAGRRMASAIKKMYNITIDDDIATLLFQNIPTTTTEFPYSIIQNLNFTEYGL